MYKYPYGNMQQLNLDWFLAEWENFKQEADEALGGIDGALQAEIERVEAAMTDLYAARDAAIAARQGAAESAASSAQSAANSAASAQTSIAQASQATQAATRAQTAAQNAEVSENSAAGSATSAGNSATIAQNSASSAGTSAGNALTQAQQSEAWARGQIGGVDVPPTAPQHENNAKYYAESIAGDAAAAAASAEEAANSAESVSESAAQIEQNRNDIDVLEDKVENINTNIIPFPFGEYLPIEASITAAGRTIKINGNSFTKTRSSGNTNKVAYSLIGNRFISGADFDALSTALTEQDLVRLTERKYIAVKTYSKVFSSDSTDYVVILQYNNDYEYVKNDFISTTSIINDKYILIENPYIAILLYSGSSNRPESFQFWFDISSSNITALQAALLENNIGG